MLSRRSRQAGERNDGRGREGADRPERIPQYVQIGAPSIEAAVLHAVQDSEADEVYQEASCGHDQEELRPDRLRVLDPLDGLHHDPCGDSEEGGSIDQRRENLPPEIAIGLACVSRPKRDPGAQ